MKDGKDLPEYKQCKTIETALLKRRVAVVDCDNAAPCYKPNTVSIDLLIRFDSNLTLIDTAALCSVSLWAE